jgi:hypothetical protein
VEKEVKILNAIQSKIDEVKKFDTKGDSQMERYKEGLLTAYTNSKSVVAVVFKEYCRNEDCMGGNCKTCGKYNLM